MKTLDIFIILLILFAGTGGILYSTGSAAGRFVDIKTPYGEYRYTLEKDRNITVKGLNGDFFIEIRNGKVRVKEANCPEQLCIKRGWAHLSGDSLICIPNKIIVKIENQEQTIDAITE